MTDVRTSAPGKVIITGEYAVLDGAPAICMAVDRRAHVSIVSTTNEHHSVRAPGFSPSVGRFHAEGKKIDWIDGGEAYALLDAVWSVVAPAAAGSLSIVLDSNELSDRASSTKLGIGSSAAVTVALTAALDFAANLDIHEAALAAHRQFQGGNGSGVDIACSIAGGIIEFRRGGVAAKALRWPAGMHYALFWSGTAADTRRQIGTLTGSGASPARSGLASASTAVAGAWQDQDAGDIFVALRSYTEALRRFDIDHELGIFDAGHAELSAIAADCGVVYKPCGAGGGDVGMAIALDEESFDHFKSRARGLSCTPLDLAIDASGLRREGESH